MRNLFDIGQVINKYSLTSVIAANSLDLNVFFLLPAGCGGGKNWQPAESGQHASLLLFSSTNLYLEF